LVFLQHPGHVTILAFDFVFQECLQSLCLHTIFPNVGGGGGGGKCFENWYY
jgi:hypothetical protein